MTKAEAIVVLESKFFNVGALEPHDVQDGLAWYTVNVFDLSGDGSSVRQQRISLYVADDDGPGETVYWSGGEPKPTVEPTFEVELRAAIAAKIIAGDIKHGVILNTMPETKTGLIQAVTNTDQKVEALVENPSEGVWDVTVLS